MVERLNGRVKEVLLCFHDVKSSEGLETTVLRCALAYSHLLPHAALNARSPRAHADHEGLVSDPPAVSHKRSYNQLRHDTYAFPDHPDTAATRFAICL
jgi:hypothetical protein